MRLYDSAWVRLTDNDHPQQVFKNRNNAALFEVGGHHYDIDGRPFHRGETAPQITEMLTMQAARDLGLSTQYSAPKDIHI